MTTYNRYIRLDNGDYTRISVDESANPPRPNPPRPNPPPDPPPDPPPAPSVKTAEKSPPPCRENQPKPSCPLNRPLEARAVNRLLEHFHLGDIDSGDLLLLSVLFFLFKQDADEELLMALGLLLIL